MKILKTSKAIVVLASMLSALHTHAITDDPSELLNNITVNFDGTGCSPGAFQCWEVEVTCGVPNNPYIKQGVVQLGRAQGQVKGVVLLLNGGPTTQFWSSGKLTALQAISDMKNAGLHTAELKWNTAWASINSSQAPYGHHEAACRTATVAEYLHYYFIESESANNRTFCASGNSAGGAQVAYMLSHYGFENRLSAAVLSGGPPMARMDLGCSKNSDSMSYSSANQNLINAAFGGLTPCPASSNNNEEDDDNDLVMLRDASIIYGGDYNYPDTNVTLIWGTADDTVSVSQGGLYAGTLIENGQDKISVQILPGVEHTTHASTDGANAISNTIIEHCASPTQ